MNRTTTVVVALIAAAGLSTMAYTVPEQRALAWGGFGGFGGCGGWGGCGGFGGRGAKLRKYQHTKMLNHHHNNLELYAGRQLSTLISHEEQDAG